MNEFMRLHALSLRRTCTQKGLEASPILSGALDILHAQLTGPDLRLGTDNKHAPLFGAGSALISDMLCFGWSASPPC